MVKKKKPTWRLQALRDWSGVVFGLAGAVLAVLGYIRSGEAARQSERNKQAITQIEVMNLLNEAWDLMGGKPGTTLLYDFNDDDSALEIASRKVKQALILDAQNPRAHRLKGVCAEAFGNYAEAVEEYQTALKLMPESGATRINLGIALARLNRHEEALRVFNEAVSFDESKVLALVNAGALLWNAGQHDKARPLFLKAREVLSTPQTGLVSGDAERLRAILDKQQFDRLTPLPASVRPYSVEMIRGDKRGQEVIK